MNTTRRVALFCAVLLACYCATFAYAVSVDEALEYKDPKVYGIDYAIFYAAGKLAITGQATDCFAIEVHHRMAEQILGRSVPNLIAWFYPPTFLLAAAPLAVLPYHVSQAIWLAGTLALLLFALRSLLPPGEKYLSWVALGFPGVLMNLRWGQNAFLSAALLALGIAYSEKKPALAGLAYGLLTFKPQIAFFPFLVLLVTGQWKTLRWAIAAALSAAALSGVLFGFDTWARFFGSLQSTVNVIGADWVNVQDIHASFASALMTYGVNRTLCEVLTVAAIIASLAAVLYTYRSTKSPALRGSALVLGMLLAIPYYLLYDLMLLSIPIALLSLDFTQNRCSKSEFATLALLWISPMLTVLFATFWHIPLNPAVICSLLAMALLRAQKEKHSVLADLF